MAKHKDDPNWIGNTANMRTASPEIINQIISDMVEDGDLIWEGTTADGDPILKLAEHLRPNQ